jgi:hypothetical protein
MKKEGKEGGRERERGGGERGGERLRGREKEKAAAINRE